MNYFLVKFENNYADEFDVHGLALFNEQRWKEYKKLIDKDWETHENLEMYFGSNEYLEFDTKNNFTDCFTEKKITRKEALILGSYNIFSDYDNTFGIFPGYDMLLESLTEEEYKEFKANANTP